MIDEYGVDYDWTPEPRKLVTAVLPHPGHGRLVEKIMLMISYTICFKGSYYTLSWRDGDYAFYEPAALEALGPACCVA
jgi:hypothetical protein